MKEVTVNKDRLKAIVEDNRESHQAMFAEALEGYKKRAVEILNEHIENIRAGKVERVSVFLPEPEDHTHDYDRVLLMLDMEVEDEIVLTAKEFENYVMDHWPWKHDFLETTAFYTED